MNNETIAQLIDVKQQLSKVAKAKRLKAEANRRLYMKEIELEKLMEIMVKEEKDVKKLQSLSFRSLYLDLFGDKQQQLNKEQEEYLAAKLKHDSFLSGVQSIKNDIIAHDAVIKRREQLQEQHQSLIDDLKLDLRIAGDQQIIELSDKKSETESLLKELNEALAAVETSVHAAQQAYESMSNAGNWGMFDLVGGGILATAMKHSKIDEANLQIETLRNHLELLQSELKDIHFNTMDVGIQLDSFTTMADYVLDGVIFDWIVQSKINLSIEKFEELIGELKVIQSHINHHITEANEQLDELNQSFDAKINQVISA